MSPATRPRGVLLIVEHVAVLLRPDEYTCGAHADDRLRAEVAA